jgi:hypothetical protein
MILFGEASVRKATTEFVAHYHLERNHQGLYNQLISPESLVVSQQGDVARHERLGGLLNYYYRRAALASSCLSGLFQQATSGSSQLSDGGSPRSDAPRISSYLVGLCPDPSPSSVWNAAIGVFRRL